MDHTAELLTQLVAEVLKYPILCPSVQDCTYTDGKGELMFLTALRLIFNQPMVVGSVVVCCHQQKPSHPCVT